MVISFTAGPASSGPTIHGRCMAEVEYVLGSAAAIKELYPPAKFANNPIKNYQGADVTLRDYQDVIRHYTENSLAADQFDAFNVKVTEVGGVFNVRISTADAAPDSNKRLRQFAERHILLFSPAAAYKAVEGMRLMKELEVWN